MSHFIYKQLSYKVLSFAFSVHNSARTPSNFQPLLYLQSFLYGFRNKGSFFLRLNAPQEQKERWWNPGKVNKELSG